MFMDTYVIKAWVMKDNSFLKFAWGNNLRKSACRQKIYYNVTNF